MLKKLIFTVAPILLLTTPTMAEQGESKTTLFKIEGDFGEKHSNVILSFNKKLDWQDVKVESHGTFLQVKLPGTFVPNSGEFVDLSGPYLKKAVAFQSGQNKGALRIFVNGKAGDLVDLTKADILEDKLIVSLTHSETPMTAAATPAEKLKGSAAEPAKDLLQGKLVTASYFCAAMLGIFLIFFLMKPFLRKRLIKDQSIRPEEMKTLSVHALSPKQKLALVQVGEEKILLGLASDAISYIKTIEPKQPLTPVSVRPETTRVQQPEQSIQRVMNVARKAARTPVPTPTAVETKQRSKVSKPKKELPGDGLNVAQKIMEKEGKGAQLELSKSRSVVRKEDADRNNAVHDIKKLIRDKLKQMPQIS